MIWWLTIHSIIHPFIDPSIYSFIYFNIHSFILFFSLVQIVHSIHSSIHSFIHHNIHLLHSFIHTSIHFNIHSFIQLFSLVQIVSFVFLCRRPNLISYCFAFPGIYRVSCTLGFTSLHSIVLVKPKPSDYVININKQGFLTGRLNSYYGMPSMSSK